MEIMKALHGYWVGNRHDTEKVKKSWNKMDMAVTDVVPEEKRKRFALLLEEHCYKIEHQGFLAGFRIATEIWQRMK